MNEKQMKVIAELYAENYRLERENEKLNHYKKLYQILKTEKDDLRSWLEDCYDYSDCIKIKSVLNKLNELEERGGQMK